MAVRLLVVGDVNGNFNQCFDRVNNVNRKSGPFDILLCVGNFFGEKSFQDLTSSESDVTLPSVPTYILGPLNESQIASYKKSEDSIVDFETGFDLVDGITFLGKKGVLNTASGLKIAYLSGNYGEKSNEYTFNDEDVKHLILRGKSSTFVDILITSQWPKDITRHLPVCPPGVQEIESGSEFISKLAFTLKPRYHISTSAVYFERHPYRNHKIIQESARPVTRFISLADVGNKKKAKWVYAFNMTPSNKMNRSELIQQPTDTTECPYLGLDYIEVDETVSAANEKPNQYFYDMKRGTNDDFDFRGKRRGKHQYENQKPKDPCWFCLASPEVEKHLIVSIGDYSYLAMAKGGLVDDHLLIIPITHIRSVLEVGASDENVVKEFEKFKEALNNYFATKDEVVVYFERNFRSSHLQIQAVPIPKERTNFLKDLLIELSEERGHPLTEIEEDKQLKDVLNAGIPYFYVEVPSIKAKLYLKIHPGNGFPLQLGRELLAHPNILSAGDRIDWKQCALNKDAATQVTQQFRKRFESFDFTL
ncbi:CWF19-like protein 1 [Leptotrombidium deliense]|uniref:CWF19-like protein 1 n=1 Tax=Leptotrombidium deliense TaxID=299467 RepID=A0A443SKG3_9ACAR|nr:CWF19-like protein 1 [Leptotrombidium deliense]